MLKQIGLTLLITSAFNLISAQNWSLKIDSCTQVKLNEFGQDDYQIFKSIINHRTSINLLERVDSLNNNFTHLHIHEIYNAEDSSFYSLESYFSQNISDPMYYYLNGKKTRYNPKKVYGSERAEPWNQFDNGFYYFLNKYPSSYSSPIKKEHLHDVRLVKLEQNSLPSNYPLLKKKQQEKILKNKRKYISKKYGDLLSSIYHIQISINKTSNTIIVLLEKPNKVQKISVLDDLDPSKFLIKNIELSILFSNENRPKNSFHIKEFSNFRSKDLLSPSDIYNIEGELIDSLSNVILEFENIQFDFSNHMDSIQKSFYDNTMTRSLFGIKTGKQIINRWSYSWDPKIRIFESLMLHVKNNPLKKIHLKSIENQTVIIDLKKKKSREFERYLKNRLNKKKALSKIDVNITPLNTKLLHVDFGGLFDNKYSL